MKQLVLPLDSSPTFGEHDFMVSQANEEAYLWVMRWPNWPAQCLALYGDKGCGKTHLSYIWQQKTKATYLHGVDFNKTPLPTLLNSSPFFILDDAHLINQGEKLFHLYNHLTFSKGSILFLSKTPPAHWVAGLPDLKSRLNTIMAIKIHPPDDILLFKVIQKLFGDLQIKVDKNVINFLLVHIERSFESARCWVNLLNTQALIQKRNITIPLVREILSGQALGDKCL